MGISENITDKQNNTGISKNITDKQNKMGISENITGKQRFFLVSQGIFQLLMAVFVTSTIWLMAYNRDWQNLHTWHIFLNTTGFSLFMAQAVSFLNPGNVFVLGCSKLSRGFIHGVLMVIAALMVIAGTSIKIQQKRDNNSSHFTSIHGITGFVAYLLTMLSFVGGLLVAFGKILYKLCGLKFVWLKNCHVFFGMAAYVLGTVSLCYGLRNYFRDVSYATNTGFIVILAICTIFNMAGPMKTLFRL